MGLHDIMTAVKQLTPEEVAILRDEIEKLQVDHIDHGVTEEQWAKVKETAAMLDAGTMGTRPAKEVMTELLKRYQ